MPPARTAPCAAFENHRAETAALWEATEKKLETIADEFFAIGMAFHKEETEEAVPAAEPDDTEEIIEGALKETDEEETDEVEEVNTEVLRSDKQKDPHGTDRGDPFLYAALYSTRK